MASQPAGKERERLSIPARFWSRSRTTGRQLVQPEAAATSARTQRGRTESAGRDRRRTSAAARPPTRVCRHARAARTTPGTKTREEPLTRNAKPSIHASLRGRVDVPPRLARATQRLCKPRAPVAETTYIGAPSPPEDAPEHRRPAPESGSQPHARPASQSPPAATRQARQTTCEPSSRIMPSDSISLWSLAPFAKRRRQRRGNEMETAPCNEARSGTSPPPENPHGCDGSQRHATPAEGRIRLHTREVPGSIPGAPIKKSPHMGTFCCSARHSWRHGSDLETVWKPRERVAGGETPRWTGQALGRTKAAAMASRPRDCVGRTHGQERDEGRDGGAYGRVTPVKRVQARPCRDTGTGQDRLAFGDG